MRECLVSCKTADRVWTERRADGALYCWVPKSKVRPADLDGHSAGLSVIRGVPSSDTFFQYRSCKLVLASVICRATSFMSFSLNGASLPATDLSYCSENRGTGCKVAWHAY